MAKAIDLVFETEYQCEADTDEVKTTWLLRTLTGLEFLACTAKGFVDHQMILEHGIVGWHDFPDKDGKEVEFSIPNIGKIPALLLQELSFELQNMASMTEEERKNL